MSRALDFANDISTLESKFSGDTLSNVVIDAGQILGTDIDTLENAGPYIPVNITNPTDTQILAFDNGVLVNQDQIEATSSNVDHDLLTNFVANEHIDWTNATENFSTSGTLGVGSNALVVDSDGNVGIGVEPSGARLHVANTTDISMGTSGQGQFKISGNGYTLGFALNTDGAHIYHNSALRSLIFGTNETERMWIDSNGNVGIGTDSPSAVLHTVSSASSAQTGAILSNYNATAGTSQAIQLDFGLARNSGTFKSSAGRIAVGRSVDWTNDDTKIDAYMSFSTYTNNVLEEYMRIDGNDVGIGIAGQQNVILTVNGRIEGGFGARTTGGTTDWNDASNARSGCGYTLLLGTATNGPGGNTYYHSFTFEYNSKNGTGNMTQLAIGYNSNNRWMRTRYSGNWTAWSAF